MTNFLDTLFIKRFCIPCNTDVEKITIDESAAHNITKNKNNLCGGNAYNHIACVLQNGKVSSVANKAIILHKSTILSYGVNIYGNLEGTAPGTHAEINAVNKLPRLGSNKKNKIISLLIVRISKTNNIQNSKPCNNCIQKMKYLPGLKGYKLKYIYYSDEAGNIIKTTLKNLETDEQHYSNYYRNHRQNSAVMYK
jgi:cytidine deaminase